MRAAATARIAAALLVFIALAATAVSCQDAADSEGRVGVVVTLQPQAEFVEKVGAEKVAVTIMVPPGASPHTYEPTPSQLAEVATAKVYAKVGSGVEFELAWLDKLLDQNREMLLVDCSEGVDLAAIGDEHEPPTPALDPHIWMSPRNAKTMVENICDGLIQVDPGNKDYYEANRDAYLQTLAALDREISDGLSGVANRMFMVYHPAFGYFARDYDLEMIPVEEGGKEPTAAGLARLIDQANEHNIQVIFASPQFNPESAKVIAEQIGGSVIFIDSLAKDYVDNLRALLDNLILAME